MKVIGFKHVTRMSKVVQMGEMRPRWYGLAYREWERDEAVFYPIPINLIVRLGREIWYRMIIGICPTVFENIISGVRARAYQSGWDSGWKYGKELKEAEVNSIINRIKAIEEAQQCPK